MSFVHFIKLLLRNLLWLIMVPVVMAGTIFHFTKNEVKVYSSESVIYTGIASGYSLSGSNKADYFATSNAFDNLLSLINSRDTKQEVAIALLANHLQIKNFDPSLMSAASFKELKKLVPDSVRQIVVKSTEEETVTALHDYMASRENNTIFNIINSDNPFYSINTLDNIKANRINSSDLIKIAYQCNDAVICKQTLELLEQSFMRKHRMLKEGQSESVIDYFEKETHAAFIRLNDAEQNFMQFNKQNEIMKVLQKPGTACVYGRYSFIPEPRYPRWQLFMLEKMRNVIAAYRHLKRPYLNCLGISMGYVKEFGLRAGYITKNVRGDDGRLAFDMMQYGKIAAVKSPGASPWTGPRTLDRDGSFVQAITNRVVREIKRSYKMLSKEKPHDTKISINDN